MKEIKIYAGGGCKVKIRLGAWVALLDINGKVRRIDGIEEGTTNNCMELKAAIEGLLALESPHQVTLYVKSDYVISKFNKLLKEQLQGVWLTSYRNHELLQGLMDAAKGHKITCKKLEKGEKRDRICSMIKEIYSLHFKRWG